MGYRYPDDELLSSGAQVKCMVLREILEYARTAGIYKLTGVCKPSDRNMLIIERYAKLGFTLAAQNESADALRVVC